MRDNFKLSEGDKKVRIMSFEADPANRRMVLLSKTTTRHADRFEIGAPTLVLYDLEAHKVLRTIDWPKKEEREFANMLFSPDGKLLYFFSDDVLIYDTTDFKEVDKWELSQPIEPGLPISASLFTASARSSGRVDWRSASSLSRLPLQAARAQRTAGTRRRTTPAHGRR